VKILERPIAITDNDCAFCDRTKFENRLIAETNDFYLIATLGQITNGGYVLLIPKQHIECVGAFSSGQTGAMVDTSFAVCMALSLEYQDRVSSASYPVTAFEHGIVGQTVKHAHLHFLPTVVDVTARIRADFPEAKFEELQYAAHLHELYSKNPQPYLFWTIPGGKSMVCWNPPAPPQYLRIVVADLLKRPERSNWRNMDPELDKRLWEETVARLKPYFHY
jgi:diadenosine tetraphosphate (Ap4A) HIT family hydrolase